MSEFEYQLAEKDFQRFRKLIYEAVGISLGEHKRELVRSRLTRRVRALGCRGFGDYYERLMAGEFGADERIRMVNAITTNKTDFYREPWHFDFLAKEVLVPLKDRALRTGDRRLRVWSAGCSSGEEAYTIAITVLETLGALAGWDVRILASDVDTDVLASAARGIYASDRVADIPSTILHRYFRRGTGAQQGRVQVASAVRDLVTFRRINFMDEGWPVRTAFDSIFCRNVIIYFDKPTQARLMARFASHLKDEGYLFLGHSESLHGVSQHFAPIRNTIYRKLEGGEVRAGQAARGAA